MIHKLGRSAAVLGLGVSGYQSALYLNRKGFRVFASDQDSSELLKERVAELVSHGIEAECGAHTEEKILSADWVLISPGIPPASPLGQRILARGLPIYSEIEIAARFCRTPNIVAVTGSSGKTTVSTLIARVIERSKGKVFLCGNIGNPWIGELDKIGSTDYVVLELSSFQLMYCETFRPHIGVLLNLSPNHQDWHSDMAEYVNAKLRLFQSQTISDYAVIRGADEECFFPGHAFEARRIYFDDASSLNPNEQAVIKTVGLLGIKEDVCRTVFESFEGIEHRLEKFLTANGVCYVNDSKCTTTASLIWALGKAADKSVILIAGGHPKSSDFDAAAGIIEKKVKLAVLIGEARPILREAWRGRCEQWESDDFRQAVQKAHAAAAAGDTVLLSPACASFDMFKNYVERGKLFKQIVLELTGKRPASRDNAVYQEMKS